MGVIRNQIEAALDQYPSYCLDNDEEFAQVYVGISKVLRSVHVGNLIEKASKEPIARVACMEAISFQVLDIVHSALQEKCSGCCLDDDGDRLMVLRVVMDTLLSKSVGVVFASAIQKRLICDKERALMIVSDIMVALSK